MCIAIAKPADLEITKEILEQCFKANPDGAGFCVEVDGKLLVNKGYFTFEDFYEAYSPYSKLKALIHFRIKTHGTLEAENCHPFFVTPNITFIHNGIINRVPHHTTKSDTRIFKEQILIPLVSTFGKRLLSFPAITTLLSDFIGGSKLVFMIKGQQDFLFVNKNLGNTSLEGIWFSNSSWHIPTPRAPRVKSSFDPLHLSTRCLPSPEKTEINFLELRGKYFSFGTPVLVKWPINHEKGTVPKGAVGEVEKIYSNNTVDVDFLTEGKISNLYPYALEILDENLPWEVYESSLNDERYL